MEYITLKKKYQYRIDIKENPMHYITADDLLKVSHKHRLTEFWKGYRERNGRDPSVHRHPDTVQGFLTKEKVTEMFLKPDDNQLLIAAGLVFYSNQEVFFLTDDSIFGYGLLPQGFVSCYISGLQSQFGEDQEFPTVDAILERYCQGERHINSLEDLVTYINARNGF